ncbi:MAG: hypothetical protein WCO55_05050 [Candidatus Falkowbacteria bacterium]
MSTHKDDEYYATWPEASAVCIENKVLHAYDYGVRRKKIDSKLPDRPSAHYEKWPGWRRFLGYDPIVSGK